LKCSLKQKLHEPIHIGRGFRFSSPQDETKVPFVMKRSVAYHHHSFGRGASMPARDHITADPSLAQAKKTSPVFKALLKKPHSHHQSLREDHYKGHHITIRTSYEIEIDGRPFHGNLDVSNSGSVQYHGIPNVSTNSAVELIRAVIDTFPDDFTEHPDHRSHHSDGATTRRKRRVTTRKKARSHGRSRKHRH
jgi:hypothetical protein